MADDLRHPQSAEALPLGMESPKCLKELTQLGEVLLQSAWPGSKAQHPTQ